MRGEGARRGLGVARPRRRLAAYGGPLLPEDLYEPWAADWRDTVDVAAPGPAAAGRAMVRAGPARTRPTRRPTWRWPGELVQRGDVRAAERQLERMEQSLRRELGTVPSAEARRLRDGDRRRGPARRTAAPPEPSVRLVGRKAVGDTVRGHLDRADAGRGSTLLLAGPAGVGKSAVLDLAAALADRRGWRTARGAASPMEGAWPYAPVLEAFADLCRQHPALLDGLDDSFRLELDRALSGEQATWSGETAHQRLFVAAAELLRLAASDRGLLLVVDDLHEADEASLRLLHYLARTAVTERVLITLATRPREALREVETSLVGRGAGSVLDLPPARRRRQPSAARAPPPRTSTRRRWPRSARCPAGLPFRILEAARARRGRQRRPRRVRARGPGGGGAPARGAARLGVHDRRAARGQRGRRGRGVRRPRRRPRRPRSWCRRRPGTGSGTPWSGTRCWRPSRRTSCPAPAATSPSGWPPWARRATRVAHLFIASGHPVQAIPHARRAVETAGALGAYRDGLALVDAVIDHASGKDRAHLLARRGDLLLALADPAAVPAYRAALSLTTGTEHRLVRVRLARAATFQGDLDTATSALAGLELEGDVADGPLLLARGNLAYFRGDIDGAYAAADAARTVLQPDDPWQIVDLVGLQGLIAHQRGEWFERFRLELRRTLDDPSLATAVFDAHLCVAEYLLYGPVPYPEVITLAEQLRRRAEHHGALRGVAFATSLIGEAALLMGDLDRAERELTEAAALHGDVDAPAGQAHSYQRLAEVHLARGDRARARELLQKALPLARWSVISQHLMQRIYGAMVLAAPDPVAAVAAVEQGEFAMGDNDRCLLCDVMFDVPAAIACADAGFVADAEHHLSLAEVSASRWSGSAWPAAVAEARAHLAAAQHEDDAFARYLKAGGGAVHQGAGQPLDAARCEAALV